MDDVEFVLRIILRARDELAAGLAKARAEIRNFVRDVKGMDSSLNSVNQKMTGLNSRLTNLNKRLEEAKGNLSEFATRGTRNLDRLGAASDRTTKAIADTSKAARTAVKAQEDMRQTADRLVSSQQKLTREFQTGDRSRDAYVDDLKRLGREFEQLAKKMDVGDPFADQMMDMSRAAKRTATEITQSAANAAREREALERRSAKAREDIAKAAAKAESDAERQKNADISRQRERAAADVRRQLEREQRTRDQAAAKRQAADERAAESSRRQREEQEKLVQRGNELENSYRRFSTTLQGVNRLTNDQVGTLRRYQNEIGSVSRAHEVGSLSASRFGAIQEEIRGRLQDHTAALRDHGEALRRTDHDTDSTITKMLDLSRGMGRTGESVAALDNQLRGMALLFVLGFAQQFLSVAVGLGGALVSVASSAAMAGAAIGGAFAAGIAQGIPVLGIFAIAMQRVKAVMDAVNQSQLVQQQNFQRRAKGDQQAATNANNIANAQDSLRDAMEGVGTATEGVSVAMEGVAEAQRRVADAQRGVSDADRRLQQSRQDLNQAIRDGRREIEDLILAEKRAELQARGAALSQADAIEQMRQAVTSGAGLGEIQRREIDVESSGLDVEEAGNRLDQAHAQAQRARRTGVEGLDSVKAARESLAESQRSLADAQRSVGDAERGVTRAERGVTTAERGVVRAERAVVRARRGLENARTSAAKATEGYNAGAEKLNFMLSQMSESERGLFRQLNIFADRWRVQSGKMVEPLIQSFTRAMRRINGLLLDNRIINSARSLSREIGKQFNRVFDELTSPAVGRQFAGFVSEAKKNLGPITDIAINIGHAFLNIAEAAGPSLRRLIGWFRGLSERILGVTENKKGLQDFFQTATDHAISWLNLGESIIELFAAIIGAGAADEGKKSVDDFTESVKGATDWINDHKDDVHDFFEDARQIAEKVAAGVFQIGKEIIRTFNSETAKRFVDVFTNSIIPGFGIALRTLGFIGDLLTRVFGTGAGGALLKYGLAFLIFSRAITSTANVIKLARLQVGSFFQILNRVSFGSFGKGLDMITRGAGKATENLGKMIGKIPGLGKLGDMLGRAGQRMGRTGRGDVTAEGTGTAESPRIAGQGEVTASDRRRRMKDAADEVRAAGGTEEEAQRAAASVATQTQVTQPPRRRFRPTVRGTVRAGAGAVGAAGAAVGVAQGLGVVPSGGAAGSILTAGATGAGLGAAFGPIGAGIGAVVGAGIAGIVQLDKKFHIFRKTLDWIKTAASDTAKWFKNAWQDTIGWLGNAVHNVGRFFSNAWDTVRNGVNDLAKWLVTHHPLYVAIKFARDHWDDMGRWFRRAWNTVRNGVTDLVKWLATHHPLYIVIKYLRDHWDDIGRFFKRGWDRARDAASDVINFYRRMPERIWGFVRDAADRVVRAWRNIGSRVVDGLGDIISWFRRLPGRLRDFAGDAANAIVRAFRNVGRDILTGIMNGLQNVAQFGRDLANAFIDVVNWVLPDKIGPINLPNNPIRHLQEGGPIGSGYGGGDRFVIYAEEGEHMLTKEEVAALGGHAGVFALRRGLGGGGQAQGRGYQLGGATQLERTTGTQARQTVRVNVDADISDQARKWRLMWQEMNASTRRNTNAIQAQVREMRVGLGHTFSALEGRVRDMRVAIEGTTNRLERKFNDNWHDMSEYMHARLRLMVPFAEKSFASMKDTVFDAMDYISDAMNKGLKALGSDPIFFRIRRPTSPKGRAEGGFLEGQGHRGADSYKYMHPDGTPMGAGEAVLNWMHQKAVEPAMAFAKNVGGFGYGSLGEMFRHVRGEHAGGSGYATGRLVNIPGEPGDRIDSRVLNALVGILHKFHATITAAWARGGHASNSDHYWGGAVDLVPGKGGTWDGLGKLARAAGWRPNEPMPAGGPFRWIGWNTESGHGQPPRPNAHLHLSWRRQGPFTGPGGDAGVSATEAPTVKKAAVVSPEGILKTIATEAMEAVRKGANAKLNQIFDTLGVSGTEGGEPGAAGGTVALGSGSTAKKIWDYFLKRGLTPAQDAGVMGNLQQESGFSTTVRNRTSGATGLAQWLGGRLAALKRRPAWSSLQTQLDFLWSEFRGSESAAFRAVKAAHSIAEAVDAFVWKFERPGKGEANVPQRMANARRFFNAFAENRARGGSVGDMFPEGHPVHVIAHAGEWVLNKGQQFRAAAMAGLSRSGLAKMLGFTGGPRSFQGGGEVGADSTTATAADGDTQADTSQLITSRAERARLAGIRLGVFQASFRAMREWGDVLTEANRAMRAIGVLSNSVNTRIRNLTRRIADLTAQRKRGDLDVTERAELDADIAERTRLREVRGTRDTITAIRRGGVSRRERSRLTQQQARLLRLEAPDRNRFLNDINAVVGESGRIDEMTTARERASAAATRALTFATYGIGVAAGAVGGRTLQRELDPTQIANRQLADAREAQRQVAAQEQVSGQAVGQIQQRMGQLRRGGINATEAREYTRLQALLTRAQDQFAAVRDANAQALESIYQAQEAYRQALVESAQKMVESINEGARRALQEADIANRQATVRGDEAGIAAARTMGTNAIQTQIAGLQARLPELSALAAQEVDVTGPAHTLAQQVSEQVADLATQVMERQREALTAQIDSVNAEFQRRQARRDRAGRAADIIANFGVGGLGAADPRGAQRIRIASLQQQAGDLDQQRMHLSYLQMIAAQQGNTDIVRDLGEQIEDLNVQVQENTAAQRQATTELRQINIDAITARQQFRGGISGGLLGILDTVAAISGRPDQQLQRRREITTEAGDDLRQTGSQLRDTLRDFGVDLRGLTGTDFIDAVRRIDFDSITSKMSEPDKQQFENLVNAIIDNEGAVQQNTQTLKELSAQQQIQQWSSTAWSWFRDAIFTGMGSVLGQYNPIAGPGAPAMAMGVAAISTQPVIIGTGGGTDNSSVSVTVNEKQGPVDPTYIASRIAFERKTARAS